MCCRLNQIYAKFDEVKHSGGMLATADFGEYNSYLGLQGKKNADLLCDIADETPNTLLCKLCMAK